MHPNRLRRCPWYPALWTKAESTGITDCLPAYTVGSLQRAIQMEALLVGVKQIVNTSNPAKQLTLLAQSVKDFFVLQPSTKHMSGKDLGRLETTPSLKHRALA
jgi:hypothetical protein